MKSHRRVTLMDVAKEAGVSPQTVSRVVNLKGEVSAETRARIQAVIARLDYRPNRVAQGLARQRFDAIGLIVPDITSPFFADVVRGVEDAAHEHGYQVFLCNMDESPAREREALESLEDHGVDGVILAASRLDEEALVKTIHRNSNIVLLNRQLTPPHPYVVRNDDQRGGYLATRHLLEKGHRAICFIGGQRPSFSRSERLVGYRRALEEAGIALDEALIVEGYPSHECGKVMARQLLDARPDVTAVIAYNDLVAVGVLQALQETGRHVPGDVALVGFDDILMAQLVCPPLTTVRQEKHRAGVAALQMLMRCLQADRDQDGTPHEVVFEPALIVRQST